MSLSEEEEQLIKEIRSICDTQGDIYMRKQYYALPVGGERVIVATSMLMDDMTKDGLKSVVSMLREIRKDLGIDELE